MSHQCRTLFSSGLQRNAGCRHGATPTGAPRTLYRGGACCQFYSVRVDTRDTGRIRRGKRSGATGFSGSVRRPLGRAYISDVVRAKHDLAFTLTPHGSDALHQFIEQFAFSDHGFCIRQPTTSRPRAGRRSARLPRDRTASADSTSSRPRYRMLSTGVAPSPG